MQFRLQHLVFDVSMTTMWFWLKSHQSCMVEILKNIKNCDASSWFEIFLSFSFEFVFLYLIDLDYLVFVCLKHCIFRFFFCYSMFRIVNSFFAPMRMKLWLTFANSSVQFSLWTMCHNIIIFRFDFCFFFQWSYYQLIITIWYNSIQKSTVQL